MTEFLRDPAPHAVQFLAAGRQNVGAANGASRAIGSIAFADNFTAEDTVTINGVEFVAVDTATEDNEFEIGEDLGDSLDALVAVLNASVDEDVAAATYSNDSDTDLVIVHDTTGVAGNEFTIDASVGTPSGETLEGGSDADEVDIVRNAVVQLSVVGDDNGAFTLPAGVEGQEIVLHFASQGGGNAVVTGTFTGGTTLTFDAEHEFAKLIWLGGAWRVIANLGTIT